MAARKTKSPWRFLKDELPESGKNVLLLLQDSNTVFTGYMTHGFDVDLDKGRHVVERRMWYIQRTVGITQRVAEGQLYAWMPMPEMPEVETGG